MRETALIIDGSAVIEGSQTMIVLLLMFTTSNHNEGMTLDARTSYSIIHGQSVVADKSRPPERYEDSTTANGIAISPECS